MKKIYLIPILFILTVLIVFFEDFIASKGAVATQSNTAKHSELKYQKAVLGVYHSIDEFDVIKENNQSKEKKFSVRISSDTKVLKDKVVVLAAEVENAVNNDYCNYFWYENNQLIHLGKVLSKAFQKGEHNITVVAKDTNGEETNSSIQITAYNYLKVQYHHYDPHYGNKLYVETEIRNHKDVYVYYDNGTSFREILEYNDEGFLIRRTSEYKQEPRYNSETLYDYTEEGWMLSRQTFNAYGESIYYLINTYDDNGTILSAKSGISPDQLIEAEDYNQSEVSYIESDLNLTEDIIRYNDNGQVVYELQEYGDFKLENENFYDDENRLIKSINSSTSLYDYRSMISEYNQEGLITKREQKEQFAYGSMCHYSVEYTYDANQNIKTKSSTLLSGECPYVDEIKRIFSYDKSGDVMNVKAIFDDEESVFNTLEIQKEFVNEYEI